MHEWASWQNWTLCAQYAVFTQQILHQYIAIKQAVRTAFLIIVNQLRTLVFLKGFHSLERERHSAYIVETDIY